MPRPRSSSTSAQIKAKTAACTSSSAQCSSAHEDRQAAQQQQQPVHRSLHEQKRLPAGSYKFVVRGKRTQHRPLSVRSAPSDQWHWSSDSAPESARWLTNPVHVRSRSSSHTQQNVPRPTTALSRNVPTSSSHALRRSKTGTPETWFVQAVRL